MQYNNFTVTHEAAVCLIDGYQILRCRSKKPFTKPRLQTIFCGVKKRLLIKICTGILVELKVRESLPSFLLLGLDPKSAIKDFEMYFSIKTM